jgi:DNA-binding transcriptional MerR regulator/effector-binding domain-containing protein
MFKIGEFSKIALISVSQLRYYDEVGLLKPAKIDEWTGYRYYSAQQLPDLNRILALKELGLSLEQIRRMVGNEISLDEIRGMFALQKAQAEQSVRDELLRLQQINARLQQIEDGDSYDNYDIIVKSLPPQPYFSLREMCASFDAATLLMMEMHRALPAVVGKKTLGHFTVILHTEDYDLENPIDLELGFALQKESDATYTTADGQAMRMRTLPAVETMVTAVRVGPPHMSHPCRAALAGWVETNGYEFDGNGRELFIVPPAPGREQEAVTEIQYPVRRIDTASLLLN